MERIGRFAREHALLVASAALAAVSMLIVPPSAETLDHIDVRVLCILFCFMAAVAGMRRYGVFDRLARRMLHGERSIGMLCLTLVMLPFVCSMAITNDVALITFVPFAIMVLMMAGRRDLVVPVVVLQTLAANTGCMATPFGSPHNILIFSAYDMSLAGFAATLLPLVLAGFLVVSVLALTAGRDLVQVELDDGPGLREGPGLAVMVGLFVLCTLTVLDLFPFWATLAVTVAAVLLVDRGAFGDVDYDLLLTFVLLFVFTGNIADMDAVGDALAGLMGWDPMLTTIGMSQIVSNVPAAVMLSGFTADWEGILVGANIGGFGTPIASMASVIALRLYSASDGIETRRFLVLFTAANVLMLIVMVPIGLLQRSM